MFSKGEYVVYAVNGICLIEDIGPMRNSEEDDKTYYILRPNNNPASVLYVPVDNSILCGKMRNVFSKDEFDNILAQAKNERMDWIDDRKKRISSFKEMLLQGDMKTLMLLADCIYRKRNLLKQTGKRLSDADEHFYRAAERIVQEELAWVLGVSRFDALEYINTALS